jgi:spermidine synthase
MRVDRRNSSRILLYVGGGFGVRASVLLIGFTAAIAQIVLLRELMPVFGGNEISVGLVLAVWLLWTAVGSGVAGRLALRTAYPRRSMAGFQALLALALPATVLGVRFGKAALTTVPGESLGPAAALLVSLAALSGFCILSGSLFTAASRLWTGSEEDLTESVDRRKRLSHNEGSHSAARWDRRFRLSARQEGGARVYMVEAVGAVAGGLLAGLALLRLCTPLQIACGLGLLNLMAAAGLTTRGLWARCAAGAALAGLSVAVFAALPAFESAILQRLWPPGYRLLAARSSAYGNLAVVETEGARSVYENGLILFHAPDPEGAEEAVHYALLQHPNPRRFLLIGGGANGSLLEALKHPSIERVDYVELDPAMIEIARRYFPGQWVPAESDARVHVHVTDGRRFVQTAAGPFDAIVVNLPDPHTAQLNRYYTLEFFREAAARLAPDGVLSFHLAASENYIGPDLAEFLRAMNKTLRAVFPEVVAMPGETVHFFAAKRAGSLTRDAATLLARLRERRLATTYVREYYLPFRMAPERMSELDERIRPLPSTRVNRDLAPVAYYFDMTLWSSRFGHGYAAALRALGGVSFPRLALALGLLLIGVAMAGRRRLSAAASCTAATGFTSIGLEVLLLLGFQAKYGSLYQGLALLIAAFMAGMAVGSGVYVGRASWPAWFGAGQAGRRQARRPAPLLAWVQCLVALAPLALCALFAAPRAVYPLLALACGALGGYQFALASRLFRAARPGALYAVDLAGSCLGAILFSLYLIPVFGFFRTSLLAAELNLAPAALAFLAPSARAPRE